MIGIPLAALDVILGIAGLNAVVRDLNKLDAAVNQVLRPRSTRFSFPNISKDVAEFQRASGQINGSLATMAGGMASVGRSVFSWTSPLTRAQSLLSGIGNVGRGVIGTAGGIASAFMSVAGGAVRAVTGVGDLVFQFLRLPIVAGPLTAGLGLIVTHFMDIIKYAGMAGVAVAGFLAYQVGQEGISYQSALSGVKAVAGTSPGVLGDPAKIEQQMQRLSPIILQVAAATKYSNAEVAAGIEQILSGGVAVQSVTQTSARALFDLSAATNSSISDSAKVMDAMLQLFHVPETEIPHAADIIAGAVNSSLVTMGELGSAFRQLGPLAKTLGLNFEDTAAALTLLANAGFRGEAGGTAMRNLLLYITPKTNAATDALRSVGLIDAKGKNRFFDDKGNLLSMPEIIELLRNTAQKMNPEEQSVFFESVFGTRSGSAAQVLAGLDPSAWKTAIARLNGQTAQQAANTRLDNVAGQYEILTGSLKSLAAVVFMNWAAAPLTGFIKGLIDPVNKLFDFFGQQAGTTQIFKDLFGEQTRAQAFVGLLRQFLAAGDFKFNPDFLVGLREIFATGTTGRLFNLIPFVRDIEPAIMRVTRVLQLGRDTVITFAQAWQGQWGGAATSTINGIVRLAGVWGTYWGQIWNSVSGLLTGKINFDQFLGQLTGAFGRLWRELTANIQIEGPGIAQKITDIGQWLKDTGITWWNLYLKPELGAMYKQFSAFVEGEAPKWGQTFMHLLDSLYTTSKPIPMPEFGLNAGETATTPAGIGDVFDNLGTFLSKKVDENMPMFIGLGKKIVGGLWEGLTDFAGGQDDRIAGMLEAMFHGAQDRAPKILGGVDEFWASAFGTGGPGGVDAGKIVKNAEQWGQDWGSSFLNKLGNLLGAAALMIGTFSIALGVSLANAMLLGIRAGLMKIPGLSDWAVQHITPITIADLGQTGAGPTTPGQNTPTPNNPQPTPMPNPAPVPGYTGSGGGQVQTPLVTASTPEGYVWTAPDGTVYKVVNGQFVRQPGNAGLSETPGNPRTGPVAPGTMPSALPRTGGGGGSGDDDGPTLAELKNLLMMAIQAASIPRTFSIGPNYGMTPEQFYQDLGDYLTQLLNGNGGGGASVASATSTGFVP